MSPEALSELIFNIANNLVNEGKAGTLTTDLIPPQAKFAVMRPKDRAAFICLTRQYRLLLEQQFRESKSKGGTPPEPAAQK